MWFDEFGEDNNQRRADDVYWNSVTKSKVRLNQGPEHD